MSGYRGAPSGGQGTPGFQRKAQGNSGAAKTLSWANYAAQELILTANCTLTNIGFTPGQAEWVQLHAQQDATGGRTLTIPGAKTPGGSGLTLSAGANAIDLVSLFWSGSQLYASVAGLAFA